MAHTGIDTVESEARGDSVVAFDCAGLAQEPQQPILFAAGTGHLVHDPARCAHDVVFDALAERREVGGVDAIA